MKISKDAISIHKITNEHVKNCPTFKEIKEEVGDLHRIGNARSCLHTRIYDASSEAGTLG